MTRGDVHERVKDSVRDVQTFNEIDLKSAVKDTTLLDMLPTFGKN